MAELQLSHTHDAYHFHMHQAFTLLYVPEAGCAVRLHKWEMWRGKDEKGNRDNSNL